jgi:uncharacterized protein (TIGR03089 family)
VPGSTSPHAEAQTVGALACAWMAADPKRPLITFYDDATGERVELSGATLANWVAKTANLLIDGAGLAPGDRAAVALPPHWQTAAVLLGCWTAGITVVPVEEPADVAFVAEAATGMTGASERYLLGLLPMGAPSREVPAGYLDYVTEVRVHGDSFSRYQTVLPLTAATAGGTGDSVTHRDLCERARERAAAALAAGDRILIDAAASPDPLDWLLVPAAAHASIVLCRHLDPAKIARRRVDERVTTP